MVCPASLLPYLLVTSGLTKLMTRLVCLAVLTPEMPGSLHPHNLLYFSLSQLQSLPSRCLLTILLHASAMKTICNKVEKKNIN